MIKLPIYLRFWPTWIWLAIWAWDDNWKTTRITIRSGLHHSKRLFTIKRGGDYLP